MTRRPRVVVALLLGLSSAVRADGGADALKALEQGIALFKADRLAEARAAFERARAQAPSKPNPYRWLGLTDARLGECEKALGELDDFIARVPQNDARTVEATVIRDRCRDELGHRQGTLAVNSTPPGAEVRIDGEAEAPVGVTPLRATPLRTGAHGVFLSLPGYVTQFRKVTVSPRGAAEIDVDLPRVPVSEPPPVDSGAEQPEHRDAVAPEPPPDRPNDGAVSPLQLPERRPLKHAAIGLLVGSVLVAAAGAALVLDVVAEFPTWQQSRGPALPYGDRDLAGRLQTTDMAGVGLLIAGGGLALVDVVLWGVAARPASFETVSLAPSLGGFVVRGRF